MDIPKVRMRNLATERFLPDLGDHWSSNTIPFMLKPTSRLLRSWAAQGLALALLTATSAWAAPAEVRAFTGGDPGEGLDLQGNFAYAINVGPNGAVGKVGDAVFLADDVAGVSISAQNQIAGYHNAVYGDSANDNNLERVIQDIRWSAAPNTVIVTLAVESGIQYNLQLLFADNGANRGYDILVEGNLEVDDFNPGGVQGLDPETFLPVNNQGAVVSFEFTAADSELEIILDGNTVENFELSDLNPILNGLTLERLTASVDSDGDGLPDDWERRYFANLDSNATDDLDDDDLNNAGEFAAGTIPIAEDTDNDGLTDGREVTLGSNPFTPDSDGDHLTDSAEVNVHGTDPAKADTDGDGFNDYDELRLLTSPTDAQSRPKSTLISLFTGGDPGEGLDLEGNLVYAVDAGQRDAVIGGQVGDAIFTNGDAEGVTLVTGNNTAPGWNGGIMYGESFNDFTLSEIMSSISWSAAGAAVSTVQLTFGNLEVGAAYKAQLLFAEQQWPRGWDILVDGAQVVDEFSAAFYQGGGFPLVLPSPDDRGVVVTHSFIARGSEVRFVLDGNTTTTPEFTDHNAILNAATLELVAPNVDSDSDGLPDPWEIEAFGNLTQTGTGDLDQDGLSNATEFANNTNPNNSDTDGDALTDGAELNTHNTSPVTPDTDGDGLTDFAEINTHQTDPTKSDTDGDGLADGLEITVYQTDPAKADTDGDGFSDFDEVRLLTLPTNEDSFPRFTSIGAVTGGDPGEGLDLQGEFTHAFAVGAGDDAYVQVGDAAFQPLNFDEVPGVTLVAANGASHWFEVVYGESEADLNLSVATSSIRYQGPIVLLNVDELEAGAQYKVQLIFGEACCNRGFGVFFDDALIVRDFNPGLIQGGTSIRTRSTVITHTNFAKSASMRIKFDVRAAGFPDPNPILNAITIEKVTGKIDTDGDDLPDEWERLYFGNLSQAAAGDPDNDGFTTGEEYRLVRDPNVAESPAHDSDFDTIADVDEAKVTFTNTAIGSFSGGDPGEGLDLQGNFAHAFNIGANALPNPAQAGDATFTADSAPGITWIAVNSIPAWLPDLQFGDTPADDVLESVLASIRWSPSPQTPRIELSVIPGTEYKLQLLFAEQSGAARGFDIVVDGHVLAEEFIPATIQEGIGSGLGAVFSTELKTERDKLVIILDGPNGISPDITDHNAIINGLTLEVLSAAPAALRITNISKGANGAAITFESVSGVSYTLQYKAALADATWADVTTAAATGATTTLTDSDTTHQTRATGFWRIGTQ
jgi:hypothetical protein